MNTDLSRVHDELLCTGKLRAAINYGNPVLAQRDPNGEPGGVSVALAKALAQRLEAELEIIPFEAAGKVVEAASQGQRPQGSARLFHCHTSGCGDTCKECGGGSVSCSLY